MKPNSNTKISLRDHLMRITAMVIARFRSGDMRRELSRLEALPKRRAVVEVCMVLAALFLLALLAASFGVWGLLAYFAGVLIVFR